VLHLPLTGMCTLHGVASAHPAFTHAIPTHTIVCPGLPLRIQYFSRLVGDRYGPPPDDDKEAEQQQDTGPPPMDQVPITEDGEVDWEACIAESAKQHAAAAAGSADAADIASKDAAEKPKDGSAAVGGDDDDDDDDDAEIEPELTPSERSIALTFALVDDSMAAGMLQVSKSALKLLLQQRKALAPQQVARLAARLAEAGLTKELGRLAGSQGTTITHLDEAAGGKLLLGCCCVLKGAISMACFYALTADFNSATPPPIVYDAVRRAVLVSLPTQRCGECCCGSRSS
jgi:hypothetical protein